MPTSKNRSGQRAWKGNSPVGPGIAAVMATTSSRSSAISSIDSLKASVYPLRARDDSVGPTAGSKDAGVVKALFLVLLGELVTSALSG